MPRNLLIVFAKVPIPGACKTRLAASIGAGPAARVAEACLRETFRVAEAVGDRVALEWHYEPPSEGPRARGMASRGWRIEPQEPGDLGARMAAAFAGAFARGFQHVAIVGADSPQMPARWLEEAFEALGRFDAVLGPAEDGGYYVVGLSRPAPRLFETIAWSTAGVLEATLTRCGELGLRSHLLPRTYDVDTVEELRRLARDLQARGDSTELLEACRAALPSD